MQQSAGELSWFAFKVFFGKGQPIKGYLAGKGIEHIYDVERPFWDKKNKRTVFKDIPIMPNILLFRSTCVEAEELERTFLNKVMLYRHKNADDMKTPSKISDRDVRIFKIVATSGVEGLDFYDEYNPKYAKGDKFRVIKGPLKGAEGYVVRIKKDHKLYVSIQGLCAVTTGYIPKDYLEKIQS